MVLWFFGSFSYTADLGCLRSTGIWKRVAAAESFPRLKVGHEQQYKDLTPDVTGLRYDLNLTLRAS